MATVVQLLADIDLRLQNTFTEAQKLAWMNDVQRKLNKYIDIEKSYTFLASSSMVYSLTTDIRMEKITHVYTGDSTALANISSTTIWQEHEYAGAEDNLTGYKYYTPNIENYNTTTFSTELALYPNSTEVRVGRVYYNNILADLTTTVSPEFNEEWHDILKYGVMEIVAKSGNAPDVELANNYHQDYMDILKDIKKDNANRKMKLPKMKWSYQDWR